MITIAPTLPTMSLTSSSTLLGTDGRTRCAWAGVDEEYLRYHDEEWGVPLHGDRPLFEKLSLEGFQAGLSWITILRRRRTFRAAFANFDIAKVASFDDSDVDRLMSDPGIIRNRAKIVATISNARLTRDLTDGKPGAFDELIWSFAPPARGEGQRPEFLGDLAAITAESMALSKELRRVGFRFVGPTTMYALMQSGGMVDDHLVGCWRASDH